MHQKHHNKHKDIARPIKHVFGKNSAGISECITCRMLIEVYKDNFGFIQTRWTHGKLKGDTGKNEPLPLCRRPKNNKYFNTKVITKNGVIDSKKEHKDYLYLKELERAGKISELKTQVPISCDINGFHICKLVVDFSYVENGAIVYADTKSKKTAKLPLFMLKKKLVFALYGITIRII